MPTVIPKVVNNPAVLLEPITTTPLPSELSSPVAKVSAIKISLLLESTSAVTPVIAAVLMALDNASTVAAMGTVIVVPLITIPLPTVNVSPVTLLAPCTVGQDSFHSSLPTNTHWLLVFL